MGPGSLYEVIEALSCLSRTGWMLRGVPSSLAESVAEHSFASALIAFELSVRLKERGIEVDPFRAAVIALVHDLGESVIGDIAKTAGIGGAKREAELRAVYSLPVSGYLKDLIIEFEEGETLEAVLARISESVATILRAASYRRRGYERVREIEDNLKKFVSDVVTDRLDFGSEVVGIIEELFGLSL